jgi:hypothetical protein
MTDDAKPTRRAPIYPKRTTFYTGWEAGMTMG